MGIQKKHGKGRLDKWYKLAKEKGYRARAAFKLIQLNKRYHFLETSKVLIDLCAAPGSWCQVAAEVMPAGSLIVGVDLAPIKAIPRVISFQSDITTENCRSSLRGYLKTWKADTVLHDGAPNVGTAWVQDAFTQAELVLQSLKLATEFLREGGTFVTKVFRSRDFNNLLWVFNQLFTKVETTKPPSSRNVSAEIFVVCRGFKAPKKLDPKFLDPKSVFEELPTAAVNAEAKVFKPKVQKRKRDGYEEGDYTQFKEEPVSKFVETSDPVQMLGTLNRLVFPTSGDVVASALSKLPETTPEVQACCNDLKILGKKDFRLLLRWRLSARAKLGMTTKADKQTDEVVQVDDMEEEMDEETRLENELADLRKRELSKRKKEKKKANENKRKDAVRLQLHMVTPTEIGLEQQGLDSVFNIKDVDSKKSRLAIAEDEVPGEIGNDSDYSESAEDTEMESDSEADDLERTLDTMYENYVEMKNAAKAKPGHKKHRPNYEDETWTGFASEGQGDGSGDEYDPSTFQPSQEYDSDDSGEELEDEQSPSGADGSLSKNAALFFEQSVFSVLEDCEPGSSSQTSKGQTKTEGAAPIKISATNSTSSITKEAEFDEEPLATNEPEEESNIDIITKEAMALAHKISEGKHSKYTVIDDSFNRWTCRDRDGLPDWFLDDENRHSRPVRPTTAAAAAAIKEKMRAMNARPIKKVREAKARKKFKMVQRIEKLKKKSSMLAEEEGTTEREKASAITKLLSKAAKNKPKKKVTVVVARGANKGKGRPKGVKGRYKIVDARMKKDMRALKRIEKKKK